jgi:hypothetical protein
MNPETKITTEEVKQICARHDIKYLSHNRITTGFSHEVHRLNDDLILKLFNKSSNKNFLCESRVLEVEDSRILKPKLIATYESENDERSYIIMSYIEGRSLGGIWHLAKDDQREHLIKQISVALQAFQDINPEFLKLEDYGSWQYYLDHKSNKLVNKLLEKSIINQKTSGEVLAVIGRSKAYFGADESVKPVYWDIHFDNFIVNEDYELQAIIDLENVRILPLDYPLFVVKKQMELPHKYLVEDEEKFADKADYVHLWDWYKKYYPQMFAFAHLEKRVKLYQLLDELHLMIDWSHDSELRESFNNLMKELSEI